jgi:hypothetical protein
MGYLIPANSKKSMLIFGAFKTNDLIILGTGLGISLILLLTLPLQTLPVALAAISPGLVCSFLVFPIPHYHNIMTVIVEVYNFYTTRQRFIWKGWCFLDGDKEQK